MIVFGGPETWLPCGLVRSISLTTVTATGGRVRQRTAPRLASFSRRVIILLGLAASDLICFSTADLALNMGGLPFRLSYLERIGAASPYPAFPSFDLLLLIGVLFVSARYLVGDYSRRLLFWDSARSITNALLLSAIPYLLVVALFQPQSLLLSSLVWIGLIFVIPVARQGVRYVMGEFGLWYLPSALLGTVAAAGEVYPTLSRQLSLGYDIRWLVPESPEKSIPPQLSKPKLLFASPDKIAHALMAAGCRQVIIMPDDQMQFSWGELVDELIGADMGVAIVPSLRRLPLFGLSSSYFFGRDLLLLQVRNNLVRLPQRILKRVIDLVSSIIALAVLWPLFVLFALLIKAEDGGPVFFDQTRVGRGGRDFRCWKFRTMAVDAEAQKRRWKDENPELHRRYCEENFKLRDDPRVTRIGAWLRRSSLDELPQLLNIMLGEMSLVGPRPLLRNELPDYGALIILYERVRPGMTGLWQVSGRSHTTFAERVSYDEWYIKNWAVWYDFVIILQTVWVLLMRKGAY